MRKVNRKHKLKFLAYILAAVLGLTTGFFIYADVANYFSAKSQIPPSLLRKAFGLQPNNPTRLGVISDNQLVQYLVDGVNSNPDSSAAFNAIPGGQRGDMSYELFSQYLSLIKKIMNENQLSFVPMQAAERDLQVQEILRVRPSLEKELKTARFFWLLPARASNEAIKLPLMLLHYADGAPYLSSSWVKGCLDLYAYGRLYFSTLWTGDMRTLASLLTSASDEPAIRHLKAQRTLQYYKDNVVGGFENFDVISWRMDSIVFRQKVVAGAPGNTGSVGQFGAHTVEILAPASDSKEIRDVIPQAFADKDFELNVPGGLTLAPDQAVDSRELKSAFGDLLALQNTDRTSEKIGDSGNIIALYNGVHVELSHVQFSSLDSFSGRIQTITVLAGNRALETGITIGQTVDDLLRLYPFMDLSGYSNADITRNCYLKLTVRDDILRAFSLGVLAPGGLTPADTFSLDLHNTPNGLPTPVPTLTPMPTPKPTTAPTVKTASAP